MKEELVATRRSRRQLLAGLTIGAVGSVIAAACAGVAPTTSAPTAKPSAPAAVPTAAAAAAGAAPGSGEPAKVTFTYWGSAFEEQSTAKVAQDYSAKNPGVTVE